MISKNALLQGAALATMFAVAAGGAASAKPVHHKKKVAYREAAAVAPVSSEVNELRSEVQQLRSTLEAQAQAQAALQAQIAQQQSQVAQVVSDDQSVQARLDSVPQQVLTAVGELPKPKTDKAYYRGVSITFGGFAEAAGIYRSRDETADISSSFSKIPFNNDPAAHTNEFVGTARQSRYSALVEGDISPDTRAYFYGEFDFQGGAQTANSNQSDSYNPRIRNLYAQLDLDHYGFSMLAGQNWSLLTLNSKGITPRNEVTPPQIDAQYIPGFAWARQPQLRLTYHTPDKDWWLAVSAENPQTTLGTIKTASGVTITDNQAPTNGYFSGTNYSLNKYPDFIGKLAYENTLFGEHPFHAEVFGIARNFYDETVTVVTAGSQAAILGLKAGAESNTEWGGGGGGSINMAVIPKLFDVQVSAFAGQGIGRYGSGGLADVTSDATGKLHGIPELMWLAGGTWHATPALDLYVFGGEEAETSKTYRYATIPSLVVGQGTLPGTTNAGCAVESTASTCSPVNKYIQQATVGFWDNIYQGSFGRVRWGIQYSYTERKEFADATAAAFAPKATDNMVFTSFRYYPF
jgi:hypothetical protein